MNTNFLYHAFGIREQECSSVHYEDRNIIVKVQTRSAKLRCSVCASRQVIRSGTILRQIRTIPIGSKPVIIKLKVQRLHCKACRVTRQENIHFVTGKRSYSNKLGHLVVELSRIGTIKDVARFLHLSWDTVKHIQKSYLHRHYGNPDFKGVRYIGIDEFAVAKGHIYKTIVVDLETGRVIYIGDGKGVESLKAFWHKVQKKGISIQAVATDLSPAFVSSVMSNAPNATLVFDHFHVVKLMNDALDEIRRSLYREEKDLSKRKVIKGTRWLLLCNGKDIDDAKFKSRLENELNLNAPLMKTYYLKESLKEIWTQINKEKAEKVIDQWLEQAYQAKIPRLTTFANTLKVHKWGILAWYENHISTAKLEGVNSKIKTMKRQAYGYRDQKFFGLKILALHDKNYAFSG